MKQIVLGNRKAWIEDRPEPEPRGDWVLAKIHATPICGSDRGSFVGEQPTDVGGHEGVGEVVAVDRPKRLKIGDRIALMPLVGCGCCRLCRSGDYIYCQARPSYPMGHFGQYCLMQEDISPLIPDDVSWKLASLTGCALGPAFSSQKRMGVGPFDTILITGLGPVGLGATLVAKYRNAHVIAVDLEPFRMDLARRLGADGVLDARQDDLLRQIMDLTRGRGVTCALDCSGGPTAERLCLDACAPLGRVGFIGENHNAFEIGPSRDFIRKGLTLLGSWHFNLQDFDDMITLLRRSPQAEQLITHEFAMDAAQKAFDTFFSAQAGKVLIWPWK